MPLTNFLYIYDKQGEGRKPRFEIGSLHKVVVFSRLVNPLMEVDEGTLRGMIKEFIDTYMPPGGIGMYVFLFRGRLEIVCGVLLKSI